MSTGITARHARSCASRTTGRCDCRPAYQANVWDARTGKRLRKTFPNKTAAKQWRHDAYAALRRGDLSGDRGPRLNDALDAWIAMLPSESTRSGDAYKPSTIRSYERTLRRFGFRETLGHYRVRELRTRDVQRWVDGLVADGVIASATIDTAVTPLKAFYRRALVRGEAAVNPFIGIMKPAVRSKVRTVASPVEAQQMIAALDRPDAAIWATAFYSGLRRGELIGLRREDIDLANGVIHVRRGWDLGAGEVPPKSAKGKRRVPIPSVLRDYLDAAVLAADDGLVLGPSPVWIASTNVRARTRWQERGLPLLTLHDARHSYASMMVAAGVGPKALSTYMGHANVRLTLGLYAHLFEGAEDEAAALLDAYLTRAVGGSTVAQTVAHPEKAQV